MGGVLVTGFEPFGGDAVNPSWEAARALDGAAICGRTVAVRRLPAVFGAAAVALGDAVRELRPELVIAAGLARSRAAISVERVAINVDDASEPDNAGRSPVDQPVVAGGPAAYFAGLPVKAIVADLAAAGIPAEVSQSAGTFVCNHVFYAACHLAAQAYPAMRVGFIHVPPAAGQGAEGAAAPRMAVATMTEALRIAVATSLGTVRDARWPGGADNLPVPRPTPER
jgi:pyroglutamyl-peptidase